MRTPLSSFLLSLVLMGSGWAQVVINEVHYDPEPNIELIEYVELTNAGAEAVDLTGWSFSSGVQFSFNDGTILAPGGFLVLTENLSHFETRFGQGADGQFEGRLTNDGERLEIADAAGVVVDSVNYRSEFPWPIGANGDGVSMELLSPALDNDLGGSWRSGSELTPGAANSVFVDNAPPQIRQVKHSPKMPATTEESVISAKITDPDSVGEVSLVYQVVTPGKYISSHLSKESSVWKSRPNDPLEENPAFEDPDNWVTVPMVDDGTGGDAVAGDGTYSITLPAQSSRTIVRYRIRAEDSAGASVRVPHADDPSLNFAYFSYDGVPEYVAGDRTVVEGAELPYTHSEEVMQDSLPVYTLITDEDDFDQCIAYSSADQVGR
ncbi:MAG: lamin tail domain-containing protein, partial [Verrucomicrobiota bacterium]